MQTDAATMENSMEISPKIKNRNTVQPSYPTTEYLSKELERNESKRLMHPMFIAALFAIAKMWKQPKCPVTDDWIKKMWDIYTMEYYSTIKKTKSSHSQQHGWTLRVLC
uniref:Uncharacterized protein n=1 Tax=Equus caballus TaxID=9796 RepID=A0A9L0RPR1_HORSE